MITARFFYAGDHCTGCTVSDHAGFAQAGPDIVCACVSSAVQTVANLMTEVYHLPIAVQAHEDTAEVVLRLTGTDTTGDAHRLFTGLELQMQLLQEAYPKYIRLKHMEV